MGGRAADERDRGRDGGETTRIRMNKITFRVVKCCAAKSEPTAAVRFARILFGLGQISPFRKRRTCPRHGCRTHNEPGTMADCSGTYRSLCDLDN